MAYSEENLSRFAANLVKIPMTKTMLVWTHKRLCTTSLTVERSRSRTPITDVDGVTNSFTMLTVISEVGMGMESRCVIYLRSYFFAIEHRT